MIGRYSLYFRPTVRWAKTDWIQPHSRQYFWFNSKYGHIRQWQYKKFLVLGTFCQNLNLKNIFIQKFLRAWSVCLNHYRPEARCSSRPCTRCRPWDCAKPWWRCQRRIFSVERRKEQTVWAQSRKRDALKILKQHQTKLRRLLLDWLIRIASR